MNQEALARLRRLGVVKGARQLKSKSPVIGSSPDAAAPAEPASVEAEPRPLEKLLPGLDPVDTAEGACLILDKAYPLDHRHGPTPLGKLLDLPSHVAARFCQDERLASAEFRDYLFLDTETTGLAGAGTVAFMVGVGYFDGDAFVARQYFLRDHGDEPAMLLLLHELLEEKAGLITFNGRSFDLPLLQGRLLLNRFSMPVLERPHIDLLPPSRRLWRHRLESCSLSSLETNLLGVSRSEEDVPGWLIPSLYHRYLLEGDGRQIARVFYHNRIDLLSMVTLASRIVSQFDDPQSADHPMDLLGLGKWQVDLGSVEEAERVLRMAAVPELPTPLYHEALTRLAYLLKRNGRRDEAVEIWQQVACTSFEDVTGHVELAKHYEWHDVNLPLAQQWTEQALDLLAGHEATSLRADLEHRLERLQRKMARADDDVRA